MTECLTAITYITAIAISMATGILGGIAIGIVLWREK